MGNKINEYSPATTKALTRTMMASLASQREIINAKEKGLSDGRALLMGYASAAIEAITEKHSLEAVLKTPTSVIGRVARNFVAEGEEELASGVFSRIVDGIVAQDKSDIMLSYNNYIKEGNSPKDATWKVLWNTVGEIGLEGLSGGISGIGMGEAFNAFNRGNIKQTGSRIKSGIGIDGLLEIASDFTHKSPVQKVAARISKDLNAGKTVSDLEVGRLYQIMTEEVKGSATKAYGKYMSEDLKKVIGDFKTQKINAHSFLLAAHFAIQAEKAIEGIERPLMDIHRGALNLAGLTYVDINSKFGNSDMTFSDLYVSALSNFTNENSISFNERTIAEAVAQSIKKNNPEIYAELSSGEFSAGEMLMYRANLLDENNAVVSKYREVVDKARTRYENAHKTVFGEIAKQSSFDTLTTGENDNIIESEERTAPDALTENSESKATSGNTSGISSVAVAMEGSFKPGALKSLMTQFEATGERFEDFVQSTVASYRKNGTIGDLASYFTDGGKSVVEAIESLEGENNELEFEGSIRGRADDINGNLERNAGERAGRDGEGIPGETGDAEEATRNGIKGTERTERRKVKTVTFDEIVAEDYSEEMTSLQTENRNKYGIETRYFMGECVDDTGDKGDAFYYDGVLYLQADKGNLRGRSHHEITHHNAKTKAYEKYKKAVFAKMPKEQYDTWYGQIKEDYSDVLMRYLKDKLEDSDYSLTDEELLQLEKDYIEEEMLANINGELVDFASEYIEEIAAFRREIDRTQNNTNAEASAESKAENKVSEYSEETDAGGEVRYSLFPGGVFPPFNKSHSDANERATRWAHDEDIETGAQRIFFYKGDAYLVEKFDSMDLGYLVVEKLKKKDVERYNRRKNEYKKEKYYVKDNGLQPGRIGTVSNNGQNRGIGEDSRGSSDDNNSSDRHNGEAAEVQGMDRNQDGKRSSEHNGSRNNEHSVEDSKGELTYDDKGNEITLVERFSDSKDIRYNLTQKKGDKSSGHEQNSNSKELGRNQTESEIEAYDRVGKVGHTQSKESNTSHTKRIHRSGVSAETLTSSGLTAEQATLKEQNKLNDMATEFYVEAKENGEQQTDVFVTEHTVYYPDSAFERNDISVSNGVASFTEKRFSDLIEEYSVPTGGQHRDYAKAYVAYMSPSDFLRLTAINEELIVLDTAKYGNLNVEILQNNDVRQGPYLEIDFEDGRVYEHNGRHRMVMLRDAGIEKVAIVIRDIDGERNKYTTTKHSNVTLLGQKFHSGESAPGKVTVDEIIPLSPNYRDEVSEKFVDVKSDIKYNLTTKTQDEILEIAESIQGYEDFVELARKNKHEYVSSVRSNETLQKRLENAKKQMKVTTTPVANNLKAGKVTKDIIDEMEGTIKAKDLEDRVIDAYNTYLAALKKAGKVKSKVQEANDNMVKAFADISIDIVDSARGYVESEDYVSLRDWLKSTDIKIPDDAKADLDYTTFRKKHLGSTSLTNDGVSIDVAYMELCSLFPHLFSEKVTHPADQAQRIADVLDNLKATPFNPHEEYFDAAVEYAVSRFVSEADGIVDTTTTKADKMVRKAAYKKEEAVNKAKADFEKKFFKYKADAEETIKKYREQVSGLKYERFWERHLSKEEKTKAIRDMRERRA